MQTFQIILSALSSARRQWPKALVGRRPVGGQWEGSISSGAELCNQVARYCRNSCCIHDYTRNRHLRAARARRGPLARGVRTEICAAVGRSAQRPRTSYRVTCLTVPRRGRRCCISEPEAVLYQCAVPWRCGLLSCCWTGLPIAPMPRSHNFANRSASMHVFLHPPWLRSRRGAACFQIDYDKLEEEWMEDEDADGGALSELSFATPA